MDVSWCLMQNGTPIRSPTIIGFPQFLFLPSYHYRSQCQSWHFAVVCSSTCWAGSAGKRATNSKQLPRAHGIWKANLNWVNNGVRTLWRWTSSGAGGRWRWTRSLWSEARSWSSSDWWNEAELRCTDPREPSTSMRPLPYWKWEVLEQRAQNRCLENRCAR